MKSMSVPFARVAAAGSVVLALALPAMAFPLPPSPREVHERVRRDLGRLIDLPRRIHRAHVEALDAFFGGRSYYAPHHHYHATYRFPVYVGGRVIYRPYSYCNDSLFIGTGEVLPPIAIGVTAGPPAFVYDEDRVYRPPVTAYGYVYSSSGGYDRHGRGHGRRHGHRHDDRGCR